MSGYLIAALESSDGAVASRSPQSKQLFQRHIDGLALVLEECSPHARLCIMLAGGKHHTVSVVVVCRLPNALWALSQQQLRPITSPDDRQALSTPAYRNQVHKIAIAHSFCCS